MDLSPDLIDALAEFESFEVEYLVIGGWAVSTHAKPRFTKDLDLWIGIDLLRSIPGITFEEAWPRRARARWGTLSVNLIGLDDLIAAKRAAGRPQDLADLEQLLAVKQRAGT